MKNSSTFQAYIENLKRQFISVMQVNFSIVRVSNEVKYFYRLFLKQILKILNGSLSVLKNRNKNQIIFLKLSTMSFSIINMDSMSWIQMLVKNHK